ncbi:MAG TPA: CoA transferase, partial [Ilumatobacteraceae bacterium]|nr:CoA transferase [Ilumatobacteraceae bacterium]
MSVLGVLPRLMSTGSGELLDVSSFECTTIEHGMHPVTFSSMAQRPFQSSRGTPVPGIEPTSDGLVGFFVITGQQWLDFCSMIGRTDWADDERLFIATERRLRADELLGPIREWTTKMTTAEIVELASLMRIPVSPIGS